MIEPSNRLLRVDFRSLWQYRELIYFLVWREVKVRYKQTALGVAWVLVQPLVTMLIFYMIFGLLARIPSGDLPYPLFALSALLPWSYFAGALQRSSESVVADAQLVRKVYFPRLILPLAAALSGVVDFLISFALLLALIPWYGYGIGRVVFSLLLAPCLIFFAFVTALAVGLWLAALNVRYRDIKHTVPFVIQIWMFLSPVVYPVDLIPGRYRLLYGLNPMVGVIEGLRWALLGSPGVEPAVVAVSAAVVATVLAGGLMYFRYVERTIADVV